MMGVALFRESAKQHPARWVGALALIVPLLVYNQTRARVWALDTLYAIDSAEMVLAATTLGVDHPPGHPLYLIFAHLFSALPFPIPDEGVILTSAVFMALAACFLSLCVYTHTRHAGIAVATGWTLAFARVFWFHASIAEVYAVQLAAVCAVLYALARWFRTREPTALICASFLFGLTATSNVLLAALIFPGLVYVLAVSTPVTRTGGRRQIALCLASAVLGSTPLLYVPIRVFGDGFISDFVFLSGYEPLSPRWLFWYFTAEEFTGSRLAVTSIKHVATLFTGFLATLSQNTSFLVPILAAVTLLGVFVRRLRRGVPDHFSESLALMLVTATSLALPYDVADKDVFFMPAFLFFIALAGLGAHRILTGRLFARLPASVRYGIFPALSLVLLLTHFQTVSAITRNTGTYDLREARYRALPVDATIVSTDDGRATRYKYFREVRGLRHDVTVETLGRLAPRFVDGTSSLRGIAPALNVADRLRVLKGLIEESGEAPLYTILDDRMPPELDHFQIRRAAFDPRLLELMPKVPAASSGNPIGVQIPSAEDTFQPVDFVGIDLIGLDRGITRVLTNPVSALIGRSEFFTLTVVTRKRAAGQYFAEVAFANERLEIPSTGGFTAARSVEVAPVDLPIGHSYADRFTFKIPATIAPGAYTIVVRLNSVVDAPLGTYRGRAVRSLSAVPANQAWKGQVVYQPLARVLLR